MSVLTGSAPVSEMSGYQKEVIAYTKGGDVFFVPLMVIGPVTMQRK